MNSKHHATDLCEPVPVAMNRQPGVGPAVPKVTAVRLSSQTLFLGAHEVEIEHHGAVYRLRQTALGKLILTK